MSKPMMPDAVQTAQREDEADFLRQLAQHESDFDHLIKGFSDPKPCRICGKVVANPCYPG